MELYYLAATPRRRKTYDTNSRNLRRDASGHNAVIQNTDNITREKSTGVSGVDDDILRSSAISDKKAVKTNLPNRCNHNHGCSPPVIVYVTGRVNAYNKHFS